MAENWPSLYFFAVLDHDCDLHVFRYYYDLNILIKLDGRKLVYQFGDLTNG